VQPRQLGSTLIRVKFTRPRLLAPAAATVLDRRLRLEQIEHLPPAVRRHGRITKLAATCRTCQPFSLRSHRRSHRFARPPSSGSVAPRCALQACRPGLTPPIERIHLTPTAGQLSCSTAERSRPIALGSPSRWGREAHSKASSREKDVMAVLQQESGSKQRGAAWIDCGESKSPTNRIAGPSGHGSAAGARSTELALALVIASMPHPPR